MIPLNFNLIQEKVILEKFSILQCKIISCMVGHYLYGLGCTNVVPCSINNPCVSHVSYVGMDGLMLLYTNTKDSEISAVFVNSSTSSSSSSSC